MADLIDRAPMLEFLDLQHYDKDMYVTQYNPELIYSWLESQPAVDAVEVVRCKDCKQFMEYTKEYKRCVEGADGDCRIRLFHSCDKQFIACKYSDFCSYGERKEDG